MRKALDIAFVCLIVVVYAVCFLALFELFTMYNIGEHP